jgi:hypothetical protein
MTKIRKFPLPANSSEPVYGLGLLTDEPDYRVCWLLNHHFNFELVRTEDISVTDKNSPDIQSYTCFESISGHQPSVKLIANRSKAGLWLTVFRQVDFLLAVSGQDPAGQYLDELKSSLASKIPQIRGLFRVPLPSFCYL